MKVKLLKKIRAKYVLSYNPNKESYVMSFKRNWYTETNFKEFATKKDMFLEYRWSILMWCGVLYNCYKKNKKSLQTIKHCEK